MEDLREHLAHYNEWGDVCHCGWGAPSKHNQERYGSLQKEASKLEWLKDRPDMKEPRNQYWLNHMLESGLAHERTDKLLPWLHREFKKGRLLPDTSAGRPWPSLNSLVYRTDGSPFERSQGQDNLGEDAVGDPRPWTNEESLEANTLHPNNKYLELSHLGEMQELLEEMKKKRQGVDVMQHKVHELIPKIEDFKDWKRSQDRKDLGEPIHTFPDGWTIRQLRNAEEMEDEGQHMGHCIGSDEHGCPQRQEEGTSVFASLRDPNNFPHATIEMSPHKWDQKNRVPRVGPTSVTHQFYGKEDSNPLPEYEARVNKWLEPHGIVAEPGGDGPEGWDEPDADAGVAYVNPADNVLVYNSIHGDHQYDPYIGDTDNGAPPGVNTDYELETPEWRYIAENFLTGQPLPREGEDHLPQSPGQEAMPIDDPRPLSLRGDGPDATARSNFYQHLMNNDHAHDFEDELNWSADPSNPNHQRLVDEWNVAKEQYMDPQGSLGWKPYRWQDDQQPLFTPNDDIAPKRSLDQYDQWFQRNPDGSIKVGEDGKGIPMPPPQGPIRAPYTYSHRNAKPLYHRWVFSPTKGVTLGTNADDHPALVKYHRDLGKDINDTDLVHGYAYPIGNGWRLTDQEHQALDDPYIINQVVRQLNQEEDPQTLYGSWHPELNWDRLHHGLPQPSLQISS